MLPGVRAQTITPIQLYGVNYNTRQGPDWDANRCKSEAQIREELALIAKFTTRLRVLSCTDCLEGPVVLKLAKELGLKMWFGLWVSDDEAVFEGELTCLRQVIDQFDDTVLGVSVGSEAVYRGDVNVDQIVSYLQAAKQVVADAGRETDLPVAICDVDDTYEGRPRMMRATDLVLANAFPFWEGVEVGDAVDYLVNEKLPGGWDLASDFGKDFVLGETGWASEGYNRYASEASPENLARYFRDFYCTVDRQLHWKYFWFGAFDTVWRIQQEEEDDTVEGHFGLFYTNMTLKPGLQQPFSCDGSDVEYAFVLDGPMNTSAPAAAPQPAPAATPTAQPDATTPTESSQPTEALTPASCASNPQCDALGLIDDCCPTVDGIFLGCCEDIPTPSPDAASSSYPTAAPAPGASSSPAPSRAQDAIPTSESPSDSPIALGGIGIGDDGNDDNEGNQSDAPSSVPTYLNEETLPTSEVASQMPTPFDATAPRSTSGADGPTGTSTSRIAGGCWTVVLAIVVARGLRTFL